MQQTHAVHKQLIENALQRQGLVEGWRRNFKGELILSIKEERDALSQIHARLREALAIAQEEGAEASDIALRVRAMVDVSKAISLADERLFQLGMLPQRPKGNVPGRPPKRNGDHAEPIEAQTVPEAPSAPSGE